ncbi:MAG: pyrroloquinoline quinone biosynthesis peptide chaperone PqqD [Nitrospiraceae bacterium]
MTADSYPTLTPEARLRFDRISGKFLLLYPERGLILNSTARDILRLCTGTYTVRMIVDELSAMHCDVLRTSLAQDVYDLLHQLIDLGLIHEQV